MCLVWQLLVCLRSRLFADNICTYLMSCKALQVFIVNGQELHVICFFFFLFRICNNNKVQGVYYDEWAWMWLEYLYGFFLFYFFFCPFICYSMFCHTVKIPNVDSWLFQSLVRFYIWTYWKYVATRGHYITRILQNMQEGFIFWGVFS